MNRLFALMLCVRTNFKMVMSAEEWTSVRHAHEKVCVKRKASRSGLLIFVSVFCLMMKHIVHFQEF